MRKDKFIIKFTDIQKEIFIGVMLGDAHLQEISLVTYHLKIEQSADKREYVDHLYEIFKNFCSSQPLLKIKVDGTRSWIFQTRTSISLNFYAKQFYSGKKKIIPSLIERWLTPRALAYWFMDHGSIKSKKSKATLLNTQAFTKEEVDLLCHLLTKKFNLRCKPRNQRNQYQIYISGYSYHILKTLIYPFLLDSMKYKFLVERKGNIDKHKNA